MRIAKVLGIVLSAGVALAVSGALEAQDKITVPLSNPSQPATIKARLITGNITITVGTGPEIVIDGAAARRRGRNSTPPPGMHRIDLGGGFDVEEDHNVVNIRSEIPTGENLVIQAPANTSLDIKTVNAARVDITGLNGDLAVENTNGSINLTNVSGAVVAHTLNGNITVSLDKAAPDKAMSFTSLNGKVDVTLPGDTKARLRLKTDRGSVFSDFDVKLESDNTKPTVEDSRGQNGRYRIRMDRGVYGSINGGGPEYLFQTMNGDILIHKK